MVRREAHGVVRREGTHLLEDRELAVHRLHAEELVAVGAAKGAVHLPRGTARGGDKGGRRTQAAGAAKGAVRPRGRRAPCWRP